MITFLLVYILVHYMSMLHWLKVPVFHARIWTLPVLLKVLLIVKWKAKKVIHLYSPVADIVFVRNMAEQWKQWNSENDIL